MNSTGHGDLIHAATYAIYSRRRRRVYFRYSAPLDHKRQRTTAPTISCHHLPSSQPEPGSASALKPRLASAAVLVSLCVGTQPPPPSPVSPPSPLGGPPSTQQDRTMHALTRLTASSPPAFWCHIISDLEAPPPPPGPHRTSYYSNPNHLNTTSSHCFDPPPGPHRPPTQSGSSFFSHRDFKGLLTM